MAHVYSGMAAYPHWSGARFFNIPWWVPFEFAFAAWVLLRLIRSSSQRIGWRCVLISSIWTLAIYLGTSFIPESMAIFKSGALLLAVAAQVWWAEVYSSTRSRLEILGVALGGCGFEIFLGRMEVFVYFPSPSVIFGGIPLWLGLIYASVAVTIQVSQNKRR